MGHWRLAGKVLSIVSSDTSYTKGYAEKWVNSRPHLLNALAYVHIKSTYTISIFVSVDRSHMQPLVPFHLPLSVSMIGFLSPVFCILALIGGNPLTFAAILLHF